MTKRWKLLLCERSFVYMEATMVETAKRPAGLKTREAILEAARHLFLRQGYHATGMREIARESGISLGAVYNHFSSKEEIFAALLDQRNLYAAINEGLSRAHGETVADLLESGFAEVMAMLQGRGDFPLFLFIDVLEFQGRHVAQLVSQVIPNLLGYFQRLYEVGQRTGEMRDVPPALLARSYFGFIMSSFIIENALGVLFPSVKTTPLHVENWQQGTVDILLHGVLKDPGKGEGE